MKLTLRQFAAVLFSGAAVGKAETLPDMKCPVCHTKSSGSFGALAVALDGKYGATGDPYASTVGWIPSRRLYVCEKCGVVFTQKAK